jgi:hypothetical protein
METQRSESPEASSAGEADPFIPLLAAPEERPGLDPGEVEPETTEGQRPAARKRIGMIEGHLPELVEPLDPADPDTAFTETRFLRHDGWNPERMRTFLERFAECGVIREACEAAGMSARSAYNLRDRDPLFAAGWEAATLIARPRLADEAFSRSMNGVVERIYRDGVIVAERHRYDNRLTMAVLARLDARADRAEEKGAPPLRLVARWDDYLDALAEGRRDDGLALLDPPVLSEVEGPPPPSPEVHESARDRELRELRESAATRDLHSVWEDEHEPGTWWTDYPPPPGFAGEEEGEYGGDDYRRALSPEEQAVIDAQVAEEEAEERAVGEAQRAAFFGG